VQTRPKTAAVNNAQPGNEWVEDKQGLKLII
jgi:hypothetical protein